MRHFWHQKHRRRIFAAVMLLSLLLQVQMVFACQMADKVDAAAQAKAKACCCDDMQGMHDQPHPEGEPCCEFTAELTLKGADPDKEQRVVLPKQPSHELPEASAYLVLAAIWPEDGLLDATIPFFGALSEPPGTPGTKTFLSTHRLRI